MTGVAASDRGRSAILSDLSPAAAFIAYNLNTPIDERRYLDAVRAILAASKDLERELYVTHCRTCARPIPMLYTVWSYGMRCSRCHEEFLLWDVARDERASVRESKIRGEFSCPSCGDRLRKRELQKTQRHPVQVGYKCCGGGLAEAKAPLDVHDLRTLQSISERGVPDDLWYPTARLYRQPEVDDWNAGRNADSSLRSGRGDSLAREKHNLVR